MAVEHDTIIVGAGSAGCILANRLSADPARRVLLVEAGGEPDPRLTPIRGATFQLQGTRQDWGYVTAAQKHLNGRCIGYARGKCIGGSAAINASLYVRGNAGDYDAWAAAGNKGWSYAEVLPYFRKAECHAEIRNGYHGAEGPLPIERDVFRHPITEVFLAAAQETGCTFNPDYNGETQEGCCYYESNTRSGTRVSTADAYLSPAVGRPNLDVLSNAHVTRIPIARGRAQGIEVAVEGAKEFIAAGSGVVLAAGAIGSPQILMLSGVGPAKALEIHDIEVACDLPGVGQGLEDHVSAGPTWAVLKDPQGLFGDDYATFDDALRAHEAGRSDHLKTLYVSAGAFRKLRPEDAYPSLQTAFIPGVSEMYRAEDGPDSGRVHLGGFICRPKSRGSITLASGDPFTPPVIDPNFLAETEDMEAAVALNVWNRDILSAPAFRDIAEAPALPDIHERSELETYIRATAVTIWHPSSTCRMGIDAAAVVTPALELRGVEGLHVCDASVMPSSVSGNIHAAVIMIAEKGSELIAGQDGV